MQGNYKSHEAARGACAIRAVVPAGGARLCVGARNGGGKHGRGNAEPRAVRAAGPGGPGGEGKGKRKREGG